jgi:hypothetical protein
MDICYYMRKICHYPLCHYLRRNKIIPNNVENDYYYKMIDEEEKTVITIYCPKCGHKINSYK